MIIQSKRVWFDEKWCSLQVEILDGKITRILPYGLEKADKDYGNDKILPGLIDIHNHGYDDSDSNHASKEWLARWAKYLPSEGVTSTLATTSANPEEGVINSMKVIADFIESDYEGAKFLGIYSEGPFICEKYKGGQNWAYHIVPDKDYIDKYLEASRNHLLYVMLAPEMLNGDMSVIKYLVSKNIVVTCGHTGATFEEISQAREAGANCFTHTYNGMRGLHHREPGVVGAAMYYDDMYCELIGDGVHVNKVSGKILAKIKGKDKLITVTDSVIMKGWPVGEYHKDDGRVVYVCEDGVRRQADGTITGSANRMNKLLKHQIEVAGIDEVTIINSATINPCRLLHFDDHKGLIKVNYDADICVLDDNYDVKQTYVMGEEQL